MRNLSEGLFEALSYNPHEDTEGEKDGGQQGAPQPGLRHEGEAEPYDGHDAAPARAQRAAGAGPEHGRQQARGGGEEEHEGEAAVQQLLLQAGICAAVLRLEFNSVLHYPHFWKAAPADLL